MSREEFLEHVAGLVAGLQVPVSMVPHSAFGAAYPHWEALLKLANGGFGWTDEAGCRAAFAGVLEQ